MKFTQFAVVVCVTLFVCLLVAKTIQIGAPLYMLALLAVPAGVYLMNHQKQLLIMVLLSMFSGLRVPGLPSSVDLFMLLSAMYLGLRILNMTIEKTFARFRSAGSVFALVFVVNLLVIVLLRGTGLRITGGDQWGGMRYLEVLIPVSLLFLMPTYTFSAEEWKRIGIGILLSSTIPFLSEMLFLISGGAIYFQYYFVLFKGGTFNSLMGEEMGNELIRFQSGNRLGVFLVLAALTLLLNRRRHVLAAFLYLPGVILIGIAGHRSGFIDLVFMTWAVGLVLFWRQRWLYILGSVAFGLFGLVLLYVAAPHLPFTFQRALSFLPGIDISATARLDAMSTVDWRFSLWHQALQEIRSNLDYLVLGKGLTYSASEYEAIMLFDFHYWWAILTSNYHQGFLSLLIITGIPGLVSATGFMLSLLIRHAKDCLHFSDTSLFSSMYIVFVIYAGLIIVKFYTVYGDLTTSIPLISFVLFLLGLMKFSRLEQTA